MPDITVNHLSHDYGGNRVVNDLSFHVRDGEFFTLLGPSGCGKSTTLQSIAGFTNPSEGTISVGETVLVSGERKYYMPPERREIGMVFQSYALWPHMTVAQNVAMPLKIKKVAKQDRAALIDKVLEQVGLGEHHKRYPHELSGGQQQRVALARALVYEPSVLLLDEPLSNLDAKLRLQAREWLKDLQRQTGITTIYVTHDQQEALYASDRIAVLDQGRVLQVGTPKEVYDDPATPASADFVGRCVFFPGHIVERGVVQLDECGARLTATKDNLEVGSRVSVGVRPERLSVVSPGEAVADGLDRLPATLVSSSYVGSGYDHLFRVGEQTVSVIERFGLPETEVQLRLEEPGYVFAA
ncbi:ABC transporter ATP-binding protein [Streptomyces sp. NPDC050625]|uniref:ABC transporter ATP-binding protein n=1 Tax=Streptomyces sp. NPDC050625 TaxID=3154629 RepID=UPI0034252121